MFPSGISAEILRKTKLTGADFLDKGITASAIYYSDVTIHDLVKVGFTLVQLVEAGMTPGMFLQRFFCPAIIFSKMQTGKINGLEQSSRRVTGCHVMNTFQITLEDLLQANVGLLDYPPYEHYGTERGCVPLSVSHLTVMELDYEDLLAFGLNFDFVLKLRSPFLAWNVAYGHVVENSWLKELKVGHPYEGHRGYYLVETLGWSLDDITKVGLADEMDPPIYTSPDIEEDESEDVGPEDSEDTGAYEARLHEELRIASQSLKARQANSHIQHEDREEDVEETPRPKHISAHALLMQSVRSSSPPPPKITQKVYIPQPQRAPILPQFPIHPPLPPHHHFQARARPEPRPSQGPTSAYAVLMAK